MPSSVTRQDILTNRNAVSITQAAEYLGVSHKTIRPLISGGKLPAFRIAGGTIRVMASDVGALKIPVRAS